MECKELFYRDLPELTDTIADRILPGCNTIEEVKNRLLERCQEMERTAKEQAADNAILDQLSKVLPKLIQLNWHRIDQSLGFNGQYLMFVADD